MNLKTQKLPVILDLSLRKTWTGKSHEYFDAFVFEKLTFQNVFRSHLNAKLAFSNSSNGQPCKIYPNSKTFHLDTGLDISVPFYSAEFPQWKWLLIALFHG